jgi:hypothetical protein
MNVDTAAADRLPWLADEPAPQRAKQPQRASLLPWAAAAIAVVGIAGFWMGARSVQHSVVPAQQRPRPTMTVPLPPPHPAISPEVRIPAQSEVRPEAAPEVRPAPAREVHISVPQAHRAPKESEKTAPVPESAIPETQGPASPAAAAEPATPVPDAMPFVMPKPWNPRLFAGAAGRVVQIGAFGSVTQSKHGWWFMVHEYPAMAHLPAVVRPTRNSKGRVFYRFQVGTTSQAHSEVLCQRMHKIGLSCAVVGLPWKAKVER